MVALCISAGRLPLTSITYALLTPSGQVPLMLYSVLGVDCAQAVRVMTATASVDWIDLMSVLITMRLYYYIIIANILIIYSNDK